MLPNGAGSSSQFTPNGAASNYQCVNEAAPDDDVTYVSSSATGQQDLYAVDATDLPASGSVAGVQVNLFARKDDAGTRTIEPLVKTGSTTAAGTQSNVGNSYADYLQLWETNPANGNAAWTLSELSTDQFGLQEVA